MFPRFLRKAELEGYSNISTQNPCYNMDHTKDIMLSEKKQWQKHNCLMPFAWGRWNWKIEWWLPGAAGKDNEESLSNEYRVLVGED